MTAWPADDPRRRQLLPVLAKALQGEIDPTTILTAEIDAHVIGDEVLLEVDGRLVASLPIAELPA